MQRKFLLLLATATLATTTSAATVYHLPAHRSTIEEVGGPPRVRLAGKDQGTITTAEWAALKTVDLVGCVSDARVTSLTLCINDCKGRAASLSGTNATLTKEMKTMIANLPAGTPFTVKVVVKDDSGKVWEVPDAAYVTAK